MVVDEIDKARPDGAYDPLGALYSLLEPDTAEDFIDEFAEVPIDTSQVIWVATANDERGIPEPILNRMEVYEVHEPTKEQARIIAQKIYREIRGSHDWGKRFDPELSEEVLEHLSTIVPREMRRLIQSAFGNAALRKSEKLERIDFRET